MALTVDELRALRQRAVTEPNVKLREKYAQDYAKAMEAVAAEPKSGRALRKGAVDAVGKADRALKNCLTAMTEAQMAMSSEWDDSAELLDELNKARDIVANLRVKMEAKQKAFRAESEL
jgi:uncharacterized membrane protein